MGREHKRKRSSYQAKEKNTGPQKLTIQVANVQSLRTVTGKFLLWNNYSKCDRARICENAVSRSSGQSGGGRQNRLNSRLHQVLAIWQHNILWSMEASVVRPFYIQLLRRVCGCNSPKADTHFMQLSDKSVMHKLALCVAFTEANRTGMLSDVQDQYCLRPFVSRLDGLMLSEYGLYNAKHKPIELDHRESVSDLQLCSCRERFEGGINDSEANEQTLFVPTLPEASPGEVTVPPGRTSTIIFISRSYLPITSAGSSIESSEAGLCATTTVDGSYGLGPHAETRKPPINLKAIANENWIGYLTNEFECIGQIKEQAMALIVLQIYLKTVSSFGSENKCLNSHIYLIKISDAILRSIFHDAIGTILVLFTLVGARPMC